MKGIALCWRQKEEVVGFAEGAGFSVVPATQQPLQMLNILK